MCFLYSNLVCAGLQDEAATHFFRISPLHQLKSELEGNVAAAHLHSQQVLRSGCLAAIVRSLLRQPETQRSEVGVVLGGGAAVSAGTAHGLHVGALQE